MLIEALLALTTISPLADTGLREVPARIAVLVGPAAGEGPSPTAVPYFSITARAVSNWRGEAGASLMPRSLALVAQHAANEPGFVARCVKLNNYWCIKQARWAGELGGDSENHTAFATAADGADAAALLVRRYYREFNRRSALAIVRRWAPAECGVSRPAVMARPLVARPATRATRSPQPAVSNALAPRGIEKTLRARYLARRAPGGAVRRTASGRPQKVTVQPLPIQPTAGIDRNLRVQPWSARARLAGHPSRAASAARIVAAPKPVADIATGIGATTVAQGREVQPAREARARAPAVALAPASRLVNPSSVLASDRLVAEAAALPSIAAGLPSGSLLDLRVPAPLCSNDETRIRNYANRISASVGLKPDDDLKLFDAAGQPTGNLSPVLLAMSSVELGALRASPALVTAAIDRLKLRFTGIAASAE